MVEPVETPWQSTSDVGQFLRVAGGFLSADPVGNNALLTEARFWDWWTGADGSARFGWCVSEGTVCAALVQLPDHPVLSSLPLRPRPPLAPTALAACPAVRLWQCGLPPRQHQPSPAGV